MGIVSSGPARASAGLVKTGGSDVTWSWGVVNCV
jgi:hypothetical protein